MQPVPVEDAEILKDLVGTRYQIQQLLGNNPGRKTLLALDCKTGEKVVLKLLLFGKDFAWQDLKLFEREAETLRSLEHDAIPQYLDSFDVESATVKGFALVQSYIDARSLEAQVGAGRRFSETELEQIAQQLLEILDYLHSRQPAVLHRDIKPSNILLGDRTAHSAGQVYLVDFGSVQTLAAREGGTITVVGTYGYMPPEQFGGRAVPASDLYSLGAALIYLASGMHPADLPQQQLKLQFHDAVQLSSGMVRWLEQLTQPDLGIRFGSATEARQRLAEWSARDAEALLSRPANSEIWLYRQGDRTLEIVMPARRIKLWSLGSTPGLSEAVGRTLAVCSLLLMLIMLSGAVIIGLLNNGWSGQFVTWILIVVAGLSFLTAGWWWWRFVYKQATRLKIDGESIELWQPKSSPIKFKVSLAWKLQMSRRHLTLLLGERSIQFDGSEEELRWIEGHLREVLDLPLLI